VIRCSQENAVGGFLEGDALLSELRQRTGRLPARAILAMVLGGLRVRLLRNAVTTATLVLAIAFLSYTGLANQLSYNLVRALTALEETTGPAGMGARVQDQVREMQQLLRYAGVNVEGTLRGNPLDTWLIVMAMLTCTVGIANAMLMSVTERFREIATMKCLGAPDGLVIKTFLLESSILGLIGAALGIVLGSAVALLAGALQFKGFALQCFPLSEGVGVLAMSLLAGIVVSVAGSLYPAVVAARMKPVDALRLDE
jgi:ABC-type antimicrobial peptide transport system permease subunit